MKIRKEFIKYAQVIKGEGEGYWYSNKIGKIFKIDNRPIEDNIVGTKYMVLDLPEKYKTKCVFERDIVFIDPKCTSCKWISYLGTEACDDCDYFSNWKQKENTMPTKEPQNLYKLVRPISLADIYAKKPCRDQFKLFLDDISKDKEVMTVTWKKWKTLYLKSAAVRANVKWFKDRGFIIEKEPKWTNVYLYSSGNSSGTGALYDTRAEALEHKDEVNNAAYITTIKLEAGNINDKEE